MSDETNYEWQATYSPEDNKLRLYYLGTGRFTDEDKEKIKSAGFRWASKQELYVCPAWNPRAEDLCLEMAGEIDDEDVSMLERSADRAERFSGYRDKRRAEATGHADTFDAGPDVFGNQNALRAERQAKRHDRERVKAVSQWSKAEYWQTRTAGVIAHALHKADPAVRRGRIKKLESEIRAMEGNYTPAEPRDSHVGSDGETVYVWCGKGRGGRWVKEEDLPAIKQAYARSIAHRELRLTYERAMLANEGGTAADVEMIPGGFVGNRQIQKVNKSPVTGAVVSVQVWGEDWHGNRALVNLNVERSGENIYRPPTDEELKAFKAEKKRNKPKTVSLLNPTKEDAERLQKFWNSRRGENTSLGTLQEITADKWKRWQRATDFCHTVTVFEDGTGMYYKPSINQALAAGKVPVFKIRVESGICRAYSVVHLTDKPAKPLPLDWEAIENPKTEEVEANA